MASTRHDSPTHNGSSHGTRSPTKGDLRKLMRKYALPVVTPVSAEDDSTNNSKATQQALVVVQKFNEALATDDAEVLESCFFADQAFWKDQLALTWHLRTFISPTEITFALLETKKQRDISRGFEIKGKAQFVQVGPTLVGSDHLYTFGRDVSDRVWAI
ncbi:hypothetical protein E4T44_00986 [Aureobasidium sp. EXF-8845]|nr:hypothetical protein E4T44_00986 [Aureobasidium sp. EXF-8845]KAI4857554.1 hypothetical protein E4T45_00953 [Aureobasidium sp. EXF-8846]